MLRSLSLTVLLVTLVTCIPSDRCPEQVKGRYDATESRNIADDRNPGIYYQCIDGRPYQSFCDQGSFFDASRGGCVRPTPSYGQRPVYPTPPPPTLSPEYEGSDTNEGRVLYPIAGKGRCVGTCPTEYPDDQPVRHLPHEYDCTLFCKCDHGKQVLFVCPDGLNFNPILEVCDWPSHARCRSAQPL